VADSVPKVDTSANLVEVLVLPYFAVECYLAILVFFEEGDVVSLVRHAVFAAVKPVVIIDEDVKVVAGVVAVVVLGAKSAVGHWRKIRIVVPASRARGVAGEIELAYA
jgi:hypothetical protein